MRMKFNKGDLVKLKRVSHDDAEMFGRYVGEIGVYQGVSEFEGEDGEPLAEVCFGEVYTNYLVSAKDLELVVRRGERNDRT